MRVVVRRRDPGDVPALADVLRRVHAVDGYPVEGVADPEAWLSPVGELCAWTALVDDVPAAHVSVGAADPDDEVSRTWRRVTTGDLDRLAVPARLFVDPQWRDLGIGTKLMSRVQQFASSSNRALAFDVMLKDRAAIRLYEQAGCRRIGEFIYRHSDGQQERAAVYVAR